MLTAIILICLITCFFLLNAVISIKRWIDDLNEIINRVNNAPAGYRFLCDDSDKGEIVYQKAPGVEIQDKYISVKKEK
jgi:hypothetical protein